MYNRVRPTNVQRNSPWNCKTKGKKKILLQSTIRRMSEMFHHRMVHIGSKMVHTHALCPLDEMMSSFLNFFVVHWADPMKSFIRYDNKYHKSISRFLCAKMIPIFVSYPFRALFIRKCHNECVSFQHIRAHIAQVTCVTPLQTVWLGRRMKWRWSYWT